MVTPQNIRSLAFECCNIALVYIRLFFFLVCNFFFYLVCNFSTWYVIFSFFYLVCNVFGGGWESPFSILLHFHSTDTILSVATFYNIMLLCSPHRNATPSTQGESDNPASERQPVTQVEETNQSRYKVVTTVLLASLLSMACHIEITSPLNAGFATCATSGFPFLFVNYTMTIMCCFLLGGSLHSPFSSTFTRPMRFYW